MKTFLKSAVVVIALIGCKAQDRDLVGTPPAPPPSKIVEPPPTNGETDVPFFAFSQSEFKDHQQKYDENSVWVYFKASKPNPKGDQSVNGLTTRDFAVKENGLTVQPFKVEKAKENRQTETVDIMFVLDVTFSMDPFIQMTKKRIQDFIVSSRKQGYHTRMCFSTFGDYTVKKCTRFYDNNPADPSSDGQMQQLLAELSTLRAALTRAEDPGWPDLDENPMRAVIDAAEAPWAPDSQRFIVLVTDWGFLYRANRPGDVDNPGQAGQPAENYVRNRVPKMSEVTQAIKDSQMKVFAVTRATGARSPKGKYYTWDGYNTPFQGEPGIVQSSGGEFFDFDQVLSGRISLDSILQRILNRIDTTYKLTYVVDQVQGLNPSLPVAQRKVEIRTIDPNRANITNLSTSSSMPTGRPDYQQTWRISDQPVQATQVSVDGRELNPSEYTVSGGNITFGSVPKAGSEIKVDFYYDDMSKNLKLQPITLPGQVTAQNSTVYINDQQARPDDLIFSPDTEGNTSLMFKPSIFGTNDPYGIRNAKGLKVRVKSSH